MPLNSLQAKDGQNMTMVPKYNAYLGLDQSFTLYNRASSVRLDLEAYGEYKSHFNARTDGFDTSAAYRRVNLSGKIDLNDNVKLSVFVKNLFDAEIEDYKRARARGSNVRSFLNVDYAPERSVALRVDYTFF
jgi:iron complex outermembrane receptor protein